MLRRAATSNNPPGSGAAGFEDFYRQEFDNLAVIATIVSGDPGWGEDLAQEALARAETRWETLAHYEKPGAWARRVVVNLATSRRRRLAAEARAMLRLAGERRPAALIGDPEVWDAVATLPARQRAVVALHYLEDASVADIAEILDLSVSAVTSNLHKARRRLAVVLGDDAPDSKGVNQ